MSIDDDVGRGEGRERRDGRREGREERGREWACFDILHWHKEPAAETATASAAAGSSCKRTEAVCRGAGMSVVVHEECPPVGHEGRILIPLPPVLLLFSSPSLV